jgi:GT2 family glycosyltransferase
MNSNLSETNTKHNDILVSIIILNYNGGNHLMDCVKSIDETKFHKYEIILIDNNSSDNSHIICKEKFPQIKLIQNKENLGMSARNMGIESAKGNYIVFLDYDTQVASNWLEIFFDSYKKHGDGLYQPKLLEKERHEIINSAGNMINVFGLAYSRGKGEVDAGQYDKFEEISYTAGACTFTSSSIMKKIGEVDAIFFAYHDDVDYGWRAQLLGIKSFYEPRVIVYHHGSPTLQWSPIKFFYLERNRWICLLTLYSRKTIVKILPFLILVEIGMLGFFLRKNMGMAKIKSLFSVIKLHGKMAERYKMMARKRILSDKEVVKSFVNDFWLPLNTKSKNAATSANSFISALSSYARKLI